MVPINLPNAERNARVLELTDGGMSQSQAARRMGISKNVVVGIRQRAGLCVPKPPTSTTMGDRLDALNAALDAVLAETRGAGRIPNTPRKGPAAAVPFGVRYGEVRR